MSEISFPLENTEYFAEEAQLWMSTRTTGVYSDDLNLSVEVSTGMQIAVNAGIAWLNWSKFKGIIYANTDKKYFTIAQADGILKRIDRIVIRYSITNNTVTLQIKQGVFASSPVAPMIQRDTSAYEIALADIFVNNGALSITAANITDLRLDEELCGVMRDGVTGIPSSMLEAEFKEKFNNWFKTIKDILDTNTAGQLFNLINKVDEDKLDNPTNLSTAGTNAIYGLRVNADKSTTLQEVTATVVDNLTSTSNTSSLSANQGRILNELKAPKSSPAFTDTPTTPTPIANSPAKMVANKEYVDAQGGGGTLSFIQRFTSNGTFNPANYPSKGNRYRFIIQAGGGGSYAYNNNFYISGGGGQCLCVEIIVTQNVTVTVGTGGGSAASAALPYGGSGGSYSSIQMSSIMIQAAAGSGAQMQTATSYLVGIGGNVSPQNLPSAATLIFNVPGGDGKASFLSAPGGSSVFGDPNGIVGYGHGGIANPTLFKNGAGGCVEVYRYV